MSENSLKVVWSDAIATGHLATDNQHKMLIDIINELAEAIETKQTDFKMRTILNFLQYYTEWHFEREELCMARVKCPMGEKNKAAHKMFLERLKNFQEEYKINPSVDFAERVYKELVSWLVNHIQGIDTSLKDFSEQKITTCKSLHTR